MKATQRTNKGMVMRTIRLPPQARDMKSLTLDGGHGVEPRAQASDAPFRAQEIEKISAARAHDHGIEISALDRGGDIASPIEDAATADHAGARRLPDDIDTELEPGQGILIALDEAALPQLLEATTRDAAERESNEFHDGAQPLRLFVRRRLSRNEEPGMALPARTGSNLPQKPCSAPAAQRLQLSRILPRASEPGREVPILRKAECLASRLPGDNGAHARLGAHFAKRVDRSMVESGKETGDFRERLS